MARYWSGVIAGINLTEVGGDVAGFELDNAAAFIYTRTGNTVQGASGFPHTQYAPFDLGKPLGIRFIHAPKTLLTALRNALIPLLTSGGSVACSFTDGYDSISGMFKPNVPTWYSRGVPDGDYINDAVVNLIKTGEVAP